jgi:hypothetical protein
MWPLKGAERQHPWLDVVIVIARHWPHVADSMAASPAGRAVGATKFVSEFKAVGLMNDQLELTDTFKRAVRRAMGDRALHTAGQGDFQRIANLCPETWSDA